VNLEEKLIDLSGDVFLTCLELLSVVTNSNFYLAFFEILMAEF
jgi:hypothetical protein